MGIKIIKDGLIAAKAKVGKKEDGGRGYCLMNVRTWFGVLAKYATAADAWRAAKTKVKIALADVDTMPAGVPVFWERGARLGTAGHIAISLGGGQCITTDSPIGYVGKRGIKELTTAWGMEFSGYALEINDVVVAEKVPDKTEWIKTDGKWSYREADGTLATGWLKINGKWYLFDANGIMLTGWQKDKGKWYYLHAAPAGAMATGWLESNGHWYYLNSAGAMLTKDTTISGKRYSFRATGEWIA
jgi:hypothetical protein